MIRDQIGRNTVKRNFLNSNAHLDFNIPSTFSSHYGDNVETRLNIKANSLIVFYWFFFKFTAALGLVPFTIQGVSSGNYSLHTSLFRKIVCAVLHFATALTSILQLRRMSAISIKEKPELTFVLADFFCWAVYIGIFSYTFWKKQNYIKKVINLPTGNPATRIKVFCIVMCCLPVLQILYFKFWLEMFAENDSFQSFAEGYRGKVLYTWYIHRNITWKPDWSFSRKEIDALCIFNFVLEIFYGFVITYFELFTLIGALCAYNYCSQLPTKDSQPHLSLQILEDHFKSLELFLETINEVTTNFLLWTYIQVIPWIAGSFVDVIDAESWGFILYMWSFYISYSVILVLASEVHYKVYRFIEFLKKKSYQQACKDFLGTAVTCISHLDDNECMGLQGGKFFTMSYSFLGATISVLLTYVIIVLQFKSSPPKPY